MQTVTPRFKRGLLRQGYVAACCGLCGMYMSIIVVWYTPLQSRLLQPDSPIPMTEKDYTNALSYQHLGEITGAVITGLLANSFGRKTWMLVMVPVALFGWLMTALNNSLHILNLSMIVRGISVGSSGIICPTYIAEVADPTYRGRMSALYGLGWSVGLLYSYGLGPVLTYRDYMVSAVAPVVVFFFLCLSIPESPYYLEMRGRSSERALTWLRGGPVPVEVESVRLSVQEDLSSGASPLQLFSKRLRRPLLFTTATVGVKFLCGISALLNYSTETLQRMGLPKPDVGTAMIGVIHLVSSAIAACTYDVLGRRPFLFASLIAMTLDNLLIFSFAFLAMPQWLLYSALGFLMFSYKIGISIISDVISAEYFPCHVRPFSRAFLTVIVNIFVVISINLYRFVEDGYGPYANFLVFAGVTFVGIILLIPNMKETANISLRQIQRENHG